MKRSIIKFFLATLVILLSYSCGKSNKTKTLLVTETVIKDSILRHVVLFKFKDDATKERIREAEIAFKELPAKINKIRGFEWGLNNSPEGINKGFTHCYLLTFKTEEDRAIYLPHPDHKAFGEILDGILDDVLVVDYWTKQ